MKQMIRFSLLIGLCLALGGGLAYAGRGDKAGTSAAPELLIPVGARNVALGGSTLSTTSGIEAVHYNPAGLAFGKKASEAMFSHMSYIADIGVEYLGVSSNFEGFGNIALTIKALSIDDIPITTESSPDGTGEIFSPRFTTIGLTYAKQLTDRISVGITTNLVSEQIDRVSSTGVAFNFGVQYHSFGGFSGLDIGVAVKNIGPQMQFDGPGLLRTGSIEGLQRPASFYNIQASKAELPSIIELGIGYQASIDEQNKLNFTSLFENQNLSDDEYKLGVEYSYDESFFLRGGYDLAPEAVKDAYIYGVTFGAGITQDFDGLGFTVDYAYRDVKIFSANHVFTIKLGF